MPTTGRRAEAAIRRGRFDQPQRFMPQHQPLLAGRGRAIGSPERISRSVPHTPSATVRARIEPSGQGRFGNILDAGGIGDAGERR